jgi:hypothetical protein
MKMVFTLLFLMTAWISRSQKVIDVDKETVNPTQGLFDVVGGTPFSYAKYVRVVDGTPFFSETWMTGSLILPGGTRYDGLRLRLDLIDNKVHFLDKSGTAMVATSPIAEMWLTDSANGTKYHFVNASALSVFQPPGNSWYQSLTEGPVLLLKEFSKKLEERSVYGSATAEQHIKTYFNYFLAADKSTIPIKKLGTITEVLAGKKEVLEKFISNNHLNGKKETDMVRLVDYYNSLPVK